MGGGGGGQKKDIVYGNNMFETVTAHSLKHQ